MMFHNLKYIEKVAANIAGSAAKTVHRSRYNVATTNYTVANWYSFVKKINMIKFKCRVQGDNSHNYL